MERYKKYFSEITENEKQKIQDELSKLFDELVPAGGASETEEGEMVRAINRLIYRYFNDGDYFFRGYGKETAGNSAKYLATQTPISNKLRSLLNKAKTLAGKAGNDDEYTENDRYEYYLYEVAKEIVHYIKSKNGEYTLNFSDSR
jgi:hypothetical protein